MIKYLDEPITVGDWVEFASYGVIPRGMIGQVCEILRGTTARVIYPFHQRAEGNDTFSVGWASPFRYCKKVNKESIALCVVSKEDYYSYNIIYKYCRKFVNLGDYGVWVEESEIEER